jgi:tRNA (guanine37-N1)-methyltransferase
MRIDCLSIFPDLLSQVLSFGVIGKAQERHLIQIKQHDIRTYTRDKHQRVDDIPYGGGAGMVFKPDPVIYALRDIKRDHCLVIHPAPAAPRFDQNVAGELAELLIGGRQLIFIASRYEGLDHRVVEHYVDREYSLGDYIISGGELAVAAMVDATVRLLPGVLGNPESPETESFSEPLLEHPHYTRPPDFEGLEVPEVLLSGHHERIRLWRKRESIAKTLKFRPDLLIHAELDAESRKILHSLRDNHGH